MRRLLEGFLVLVVLVTGGTLLFRALVALADPPAYTPQIVYPPPVVVAPVCPLLPVPPAWERWHERPVVIELRPLDPQQSRRMLEWAGRAPTSIWYDAPAPWEQR